MEYIIIALAAIIIGLVIYIIMKLNNSNINEANITERLGKVEITTIKELQTFKDNLNENFNILNDKMEAKLSKINDRVNERLDDNFEKTNKTFTSVLERLSKIDEAQKKIDNLSNDIVSLQSVLTDKKTRGIFGEINLKHILTNVFGEGNDKLYKLQYLFNNGNIADAVLFAPEPLGTVAIDSKFPLEHYQIMTDKKITILEREKAEKQFRIDMKKHIDDISNKYIIRGITSDQAILFLPAEAIFAELHAYHQDIVDYSYKKKVWITSPTTLISTLTTIQIIIKNLERDKYALVIQKELSLLSEDFRRYKERWDKLSRSIDSVSKDVRDLYVTSDKITKRFDSINQVEVDKLPHEE